MTTTTNLTITHLDANQKSPEVTVNTGTDVLDAAVAGTLVHDMASDADYTLSTTTDPEEWQYMVINITDSSPAQLTTGRNIVCPTNKKVYVFVNDTLQTLTLKTSGGSGVAVATTKTAILRCDGTDVVRITADT